MAQFNINDMYYIYLLSGYFLERKHHSINQMPSTIAEEWFDDDIIVYLLLCASRKLYVTDMTVSRQGRLSIESNIFNNGKYETRTS